MGKTKNERICEWFFKVIETQRALIELSKEGERKFDIDLCLGSEKKIQILGKDFDKIIEALKTIYDENFVGKITDIVCETDDSVYIWRSFKYGEFEVGAIVERMKEN